MYKRNLAWWYLKAIEKKNRTVAEDQKRIRNRVGTGYTPSRFKHYLRGERGPRPEVRAEFMAQALPLIVKHYLDVEPTAKQARAIARALS